MTYVSNWFIPYTYDGDKHYGGVFEVQAVKDAETALTQFVIAMSKNPRYQPFDVNKLHVVKPIQCGVQITSKKRALLGAYEFLMGIDELEFNEFMRNVAEGRGLAVQP